MKKGAIKYGFMKSPSPKKYPLHILKKSIHFTNKNVPAIQTRRNVIRKKRSTGKSHAAPNSDFFENLLNNLHDGVYYVDSNRRITFWNRGAERITGFTSADVRGRCCNDGMLTHINDEGRNLCRGDCPLAKTIADGLPREEEAYLHHKDGHRVPVKIRVTPIRDSKNRIIGAVETFSEISSRGAIAQRMKDLQKMALYDPLTNLANRRFLQMKIESRLNELERYGWPFGIVFIDIDHFKDINDTYGHRAGDRVLKVVANTLANNIRVFDVAGRWGGEEFIVIIVNVSEDKLFLIAEKLRMLVEGSSMSIGSDTISVTISLGATPAKPSDSVDTLVGRADQFMYRSKNFGRNRVSMG